jgi:maltose O-acetyltransferase
MDRRLLRPGFVISKGMRVALSRFYLRDCSRVGSLPRVWGKPRIVNRGSLVIGDKPMVISHTVRVELVVNTDAWIDIGDDVLINFGTTIAAYRQISIGNRVKMGIYTIISDNDEHRIEPERRNEVPESQPVVIEDDVWIADRVTILKGVRIGRGSVVGAGSIVTRDIPPYSVAAGNPAKVIRHLQPIGIQPFVAVEALNGM